MLTYLNVPFPLVTNFVSYRQAQKRVLMTFDISLYDKVNYSSCLLMYINKRHRDRDNFENICIVNNFIVFLIFLTPITFKSHSNFNLTLIQLSSSFD